MASSIPVINLIPETPEIYDLEHNITWDEIAPSLQAKFLSMGDLINDKMHNLQNKIVQCRITIATKGPINPEKDREIWFDTVEKVFKIYESKNDNNVYKWERTRAAWYGGSVTDVEFPQVNFNSQAWLLVGVIAWVSNAAKNGQFNPTSDLPMQSYHIVPMNGTYFIRDETSLYVFNQQKRYTHDGGSLKVGVYYQSNDGTIANKLLETIYDSKSNYTSYDDSKKEYKNITVEVKTGDIIFTKISIVRNPTSTDDVEIYMSSVINIYRKNNNSSLKPDIDRLPYVDVWKDIGVNNMSGSGSSSGGSSSSGSNPSGGSGSSGSSSGSSSSGSSSGSGTGGSTGTSGSTGGSSTTPPSSTCHCHAWGGGSSSGGSGSSGSSSSGSSSGSGTGGSTGTGGSSSGSGTAGGSTDTGGSTTTPPSSTCHCHAWGGGSGSSTNTGSTESSGSTTESSGSSSGGTTGSTTTPTCHCHINWGGSSSGSTDSGSSSSGSGTTGSTDTSGSGSSGSETTPTCHCHRNWGSATSGTETTESTDSGNSGTTGSTDPSGSGSSGSETTPTCHCHRNWGSATSGT